MIKVIHTADIHFGMENYGKIDPETGIHTRLLDFEKALNFCIDYAIEQEVDLFLFSGDAYKTAHPTPTQQKLFMRCLLRLFKAGIPIIIIVGNHDNPLSFGKAHCLEIFKDMPLEGFHVVAKPELIKLNTKHGPLQVVAIPWPTRNTLSLNTKHSTQSPEEITQYISQAVAVIIQDYAQQLDPTIPSILASHMTVSSGVFSGSEKRAIYGNDPVLMPSQLAIDPFDYVALGHLHRYQNLNPNGYPAIVYSGSIERVDFGERKEAKGFCLVNVERNNTSHQFIQGPMRPFIQIEVKLDPDNEDQTKQIIHALQEKNLKDAIIKILYHVPPGHKDTVNLQMVERACSNAHYVVGIIPLRTHTTREKRTGLKVDMDLETLLSAYFNEKPELKAKKDLLIEKTLKMYQEAQEVTQE
ncbi:exonuclease subunit SbcD [bacterium]|nr:exonuclease subunit SbcD [bacterium]